MAELRVNHPTSAPFDPTKWNGSDANAHATEINSLASEMEEVGELASGAIPKSLGTTKGDMAVFDGTTWRKLPKGADGQGVVYDSSVALGVRAGTVASSGGGSSAGLTLNGNGFYEFDPDDIVIEGGLP